MSHETTSLTNEPPIYLDGAYFARLQGLALAALERNPDVGERLMREIERATVLPSSDVPENVVNIGSTVSFRTDDAPAVQTVTLVLPGDADIASRRISVVTPVGAALIGLAEGATISWTTRSGAERLLSVLSVSGSDG